MPTNIHSVPIQVKSPWYHVGIDLASPLSATAADVSPYIFTLSDYSSKWGEACPTASKEATTVAKGFLWCNLIKVFEMIIHVQYIMSTCS